jgi:predicted O-methyltransferase YrrM
MIIPEDYWEDHYKGKETLKYEIPWIVKGAIYKLDKLLTKDMDVLEFGSGGSTLFFSKRAKSVVSFEDQAKWFNKVSSIIEDKKITNIQYIFSDKVETIDSNISGKKFHCVLIDNKKIETGGIILRSEVLNKVLPFLVSPKIIIMDNYNSVKLWRQKKVRKLKSLEQVENYEERIYDHKRWGGRGTKILWEK